MTTPQDGDHGLRGIVRRAAGSAREAADTAFDATVGRVGHSVGEAALGATHATAQQVIEDLEPYIIDETVPRILEGITPYLVEQAVPQILAGLTEHLSEVTVPDVVAGSTPQLVDDLVPRILGDLEPYLAADFVPAVVDGLMPYIEQSIAPGLVEALMPKLGSEIAPQLVRTLMPMISEEVAPQLVDALMPKIRQEVVPQILDDIVDDPRIRDLIREQSQGLFLDALEGFRGKLADIDSLTDRVGRRLLFRPARPRPQTALQLVLAESAPGDTRPVRLTVDDLPRQRAAWRAMPVPPPPPGRDFTFAGAATRLLGVGIDVFLVGYLTTVLFATVGGLIDSLFDQQPPAWLTLTLVAMATSVIPTYLGICFWLFGRTLGMGITGIRICTPDGRRPGFFRAMIRAWLEVFGIAFWIITGVISLFDAKRRILLDLLLNTEVRYSVPENQQRRHLRDAIEERREAPSATA